jgi:hypothetical protein
VYNNSFTVFRGYADAQLIAEISKPSEAYQRKIDDEHTKAIAEYISAGHDIYTPEVTLAYSVSSSNLTQSITYDVGSFYENGIRFSFTNAIKGLVKPMTIGIPQKCEKVFSRIDGNHRLAAFELLSKDKQYIIPVSILFLFPESGEITAQRAEMRMFHNINGKAKPLTPIEQYRGFLNIYTAEELIKFSQEFRDTKVYLDNYKEKSIKIGNVFSDRDCVDEIILCTAKFLTDRSVSCSPKEIFEALTDLDKIHLSKHQSLKVFANRFAIIPFVYYSITNKPLLDKFVNWFIANKLYDAQNFDPATIIEQFEKSPKTIFMSMQVCEGTKDNFNTVKNVRDKLKSEYGINFELIKIDEHNDGFSDEIYSRIVKGIEKADLMIADLSCGNKMYITKSAMRKA